MDSDKSTANGSGPTCLSTATLRTMIQDTSQDVLAETQNVARAVISEIDRGVDSVFTAINASESKVITDGRSGHQAVISRVEDNNAVVMTKLNELTALIAASQPSGMTLSCQHACISPGESTKPGLSTGTQNVNSKKQGPRAARKQRIAHFRAALPYWIMSTVWEINLYKSAEGWDQSIKIYNVVPDDSPIFTAIEQGDLPEVQRLLISHEASIYDRDPEGDTLLHVSHLVSMLISASLTCHRRRPDL